MTLANLEVGHPWSFEHTKPNLSETEMEDYVRLIRPAKDRKSSIRLDLPDDVNITSAWESAFIDLLRHDVRRGTMAHCCCSHHAAAWRIRLRVRNKPHGVIHGRQYQSPGEPEVVFADSRYAVPSGGFCGRPVVLYGLFTPSVINHLRARKTTSGEKSVYQYSAGF